MKRILTAFAFLLTMVACTKDSTPKELPQNLQSIVDANSSCTCEPYINAYEWRGKIVYMMGYSGPACNWVPAYYDEDGNTITMSNDYTLSYFLEEAKFLRLMWEC